MYSNQIMEEFYNPTNFGVIRGASGVGKVVCEEGDEILKIYIVVENDKITERKEILIRPVPLEFNDYNIKMARFLYYIFLYTVKTNKYSR